MPGGFHFLDLLYLLIILGLIVGIGMLLVRFRTRK